MEKLDETIILTGNLKDKGIMSETKEEGKNNCHS